MKQHSQPQPSLVALSGVVGVGKTTLAKRLASRSGWTAAFERVDDSPYLELSYGNKSAWMFHLNVHLLAERAAQLLALAKETRHSCVVLDRSIYEDRIFIDHALCKGYVTAAEYGTLVELFNLLIDVTPRPQVLVYLKAPIEEVANRVKERGRVFEGGVDLEYLRELDELYEAWIRSIQGIQLLAFDSYSVEAAASAIWAHVDNLHQT